MESIPPEILRSIINDLFFDDLKALRLCWRFLGAFVLPLLFHTIEVDFAEEQLKKLQGIALSPHLVPHVQQLIWRKMDIRKAHRDPHGHVNSWEGHEDYIKDFRSHFFLCVDAMPNLRTFASELGSIERYPERNDIDGLVYALWPAMCRPQSKITSFRCEDPDNYIRWLKYECLQLEKGERTELPASFPVNHLLLNASYGNASSSPLTKHLTALIRSDYSIDDLPPSALTWREPLRKLLKLDISIDASAGSWQRNSKTDEISHLLLNEAIHLHELSLRFARELRTPTPQLQASSSCTLQGILKECRFESLRTIKISFASLLEIQPTAFAEFLKYHAMTLKHILIRHCEPEVDIIKMIQSAARTPDLNLHRFIVSPSAYRGPRSGKGHRLIPERLILDFINTKDPSRDPFEAELDRAYLAWGTVAHVRAPRFFEPWPKDGGMPFACRECAEDGIKLADSFMKRMLPSTGSMKQ